MSPLGRTSPSPLGGLVASSLNERDQNRRLEPPSSWRCSAKSPFRPPALDKLFERSRGVPRQINTFATGALLAAATASRKHIEAADVETAVFDVEQR